MSSINKKRKKADVAGIILKTIGAAAIMSMAVLAPNAMQVLVLFHGKERKNDRSYITRAVERLKEKGLVRVRGQNVSLTSKGHEELNKYLLKEYKIPKPKRWDGRYHVIIFDVKEWKRGIRDRLRWALEDFGFRQLQKSVWVYPHECEELISMIKAAYDLKGELLYMTVDYIENDYWLRQDFGLTE